MKIRKADSSDLSEIQRLNKALFDFEKQFGHEYNLNWPYEESGKSYFKKRLESRNAIIFIAEEQKQAVGYILAFIDNYSYRKENPICEIENMFVEEKFRHQGVGKALVDIVKKEAKKKNVKRLRVGSFAQNELAIRFYSAQGFEDANLYLEEKI